MTTTTLDEPMCSACYEGEHESCHDPIHTSHMDWTDGTRLVLVCCCGDPEEDYRDDDDR